RTAAGADCQLSRSLRRKVSAWFVMDGSIPVIIPAGPQVSGRADRCGSDRLRVDRPGDHPARPRVQAGVLVLRGRVMIMIDQRRHPVRSVLTGDWAAPPELY